MPDPSRPTAERRQTPEDRYPQVHAECVRVARALRHARRRAVGLVPASPSVAAVPVGIELGGALAELDGRPVALVDANLLWPAIPTPAPAEVKPGESESFTLHWLRPLLGLLRPRPPGGDPRAAIPTLARLVDESAAHFPWLLVDLTGFPEQGEHLDAFDLLDGVVVVARAGRTREGELHAIVESIPPGLHLGVLLVGGGR